MISRTLRKIYGSLVVAAYLRNRKIMSRQPRITLENIRDARIRRIVAFASREVPYYRQMFARHGIDPKRITSAEELDRLPLIDRELVRTQPHLFIAETAAARAGLSFLTSGSTGTPTEIHHDQRSLLANIAFGEREREPINRACGSFRPKELYVGYETSTFKKVIGFYEQNVLFPIRPRRRFVSLLQPIEDIAAITEDERPDILVGYGGWIDLFFKTIAVRGLKIHRPTIVMYMGEALPHGAREFIEQKFGIAVMSRYNAVESFKIGFYCEARTGFHIHEDLCHVRIVGPDGRTAAPGEQGQVVISNLLNRASVLLNYPMGDMASMSQEACPCGRTFRLLSELEGRIEDMLSLPDGTFVHPRSVWQLFKNDRRIIQYQLTQVEPLCFELTLFTADDSSYRAALESALPRLHELLGTEAFIEARRGAAMARGAGGKFRAVASRCRPPSSV